MLRPVFLRLAAAAALALAAAAAPAQVATVDPNTAVDAGAGRNRAPSRAGRRRSPNISRSMPARRTRSPDEPGFEEPGATAKPRPPPRPARRASAPARRPRARPSAQEGARRRRGRVRQGRRRARRPHRGRASRARRSHRLHHRPRGGRRLHRRSPLRLGHAPPPDRGRPQGLLDRARRSASISAPMPTRCSCWSTTSTTASGCSAASRPAEGKAYVVGGFTASYLRRGDVVLIPIRLGVGARLGINAGYMRFSQKSRWLPF